MDLLDILTTYFNDDELNTLCFHLDIPHDDLPAQGRANKARELLLRVQREQRLPDLLARGREMRPQAQWPDAAVAARQRFIPPELIPYLEMVTRRSSRLPLGPLDPTGRESAHISLGQVFINLNAGVAGERIAGEDGQDQVQYSAALAHIHNRQRLILLGDPGSGKSTLLRFLAYCLAQAALTTTDAWLPKLSWTVTRHAKANDKGEAVAQHWQRDAPLPIFIELRDFAQSGFDPRSPLALWAYVQAQWQRDGFGDGLEALALLARHNQVIFLLDGVDEVPLAQRRDVWQAIRALGDGPFGGSRWVATCRVLSFAADEAPPGVPVQTLQFLEDVQIDQFIAAWYAALLAAGEINAASAQVMTAQLQDAARRPGLQPLAQNPMLLTIMALVQTFHGTLPDERAKLYQACVETMLLRWQRHKDESGGGALPDVLAQLQTSQENLERLLWEVAWTAHRSAAGQQEAANIPETTVLQIAKKHLGDYARAEAFLAYTERRAHLLMGRGGQQQRVYTFPHRTFQEYLAACFVAAQRDFTRGAPLLAAQGDAWREVLALAAGTLVFNQNNREKALDGVEKVLPTHMPAPDDEGGWFRVWLAAEMLLVVGKTAAAKDAVGRSLLPRLQKLLAALVASGRLTPPQRAAAGRALGWLGDPRPDVACAVPALVQIPAGPFLMGSSDADKLAYDREKPQHEVTLPAYAIGKYPVTVAQYARFVQAGGYEDAAYWTAAGWQQRQREGWTAPRYWEDRRWTCPNHPVVGVSWYEAVAYCRWLSAATGRSFRLPHEAMWEKAARGADGRIYPWGDEWDAAKLNAAETGINQTSAVGMFPDGRSPYDVYDMSGNVLEWCSGRAYPKYPFQERPYAEEVEQSGGTHSWRGGAFNNYGWDSRAAYRYFSLAHYRNFDLGFRVVEHLS
ncbi:MAG: SUMF1/EgtB/PvdO family nonheme iron enzyme [Ardenticatenaceae bacterium]|nr:SUMF1/EgtB/PvdO family nonheme iron enzyme [Ardenticatenaceae bacterium]